MKNTWMIWNPTGSRREHIQRNEKSINQKVRQSFLILTFSSSIKLFLCPAMLDIVEIRVFFIKFCFKFSEQVRPESFIYRSTSKLNLEIRFRFLSFWIEKSGISAPVAGSWQEARVCCLIDRTDAGVNTGESCDTGTQSGHLINGINIFPRIPTCSQFPSDSPVCWHHRTNNKLGTDSEKSHLHSISCH